MIIVGLTGGIGSGKTFVADEFSKLGVPIYNSDIRAKTLMEEDPHIKNKLIEKLGHESFSNNKLDRKYVAGLIFGNKNLISWINSLVHPAVQSDFEKWVSAQSQPMAIKEAAILIESGAYKRCHKIIVVTANKQTRLDRIMKRDNMTLEQVEHRMDNQITDSERIKYADFIIDNNGTKVVKTEVEKIYSEISKIINKEQ